MKPELKQLSLALVFNESDEETATLEITTGTQDTQDACALSLEGISLPEFSLALQAALDVVADFMAWERVSELAEKEMSQVTDPDSFPF